MAYIATQTEKDLIGLLIMSDVEKEAILGIMLGLKAEDVQWKMIEFLVNNRGATQSEILRELVLITREKIHKKKPCNCGKCECPFLYVQNDQ